jgi:tRNA dimethylallyltransferase
MQVYSGIENISNQARGRPAELVSVVPVTERWTVARHAEAAERIISRAERGAVLDAGTGMYLNAILLGIPIAPRVEEHVRRKAQRAAADEENPRRASRALELEMSGAPGRGSIWAGELVHDTSMVYIRPERQLLDAAIDKRSRTIVATGLDEAKRIRSLQHGGHPVNPSVLEAVGVRELVMVEEGSMTRDEATEAIATRTRRLARRQMRWFDKLARTLEGRARVTVVPSPDHPDVMHIMHGIVGE